MLKNKKIHYSIELRIGKYVKRYGFLSFTRHLSYKCRKKLLDADSKLGSDVLKIASKKLVHKIAETTGEFIANKITKKFETKGCIRDVI